MKIEKCPQCGGDGMLCQASGTLPVIPDYSLLCLNCGMEFRYRRDPMENVGQYTYNAAKAATDIIEKFNRRVTQDGV